MALNVRAREQRSGWKYHWRTGFTRSRMKYLNDELIDMLLSYGAVDWNGHAVLRLYKKRFLHRHAPLYTTFSSVNKRLRENGCFSKVKMNRGRTIRTPYDEERVLIITEGDPSICTRAISKQVGVSHTSVWKIQSENKMMTYHLQSVQEFQLVGYPHRKTFAE